jgi:hypothetical protein
MGNPQKVAPAAQNLIHLDQIKFKEGYISRCAKFGSDRFTEKWFLLVIGLLCSFIRVTACIAQPILTVDSSNDVFSLQEVPLVSHVDM